MCRVGPAGEEVVLAVPAATGAGGSGFVGTGLFLLLVVGPELIALGMSGHPT